MKGFGLVVVTLLLFPVILAIVYGWPEFLKKLYDRLRARQGLPPVVLSLRTVYLLACAYSVTVFPLGIYLGMHGYKNVGIVLVVSAGPAVMIAIFGALQAGINYLGSILERRNPAPPYIAQLARGETPEGWKATVSHHSNELPLTRWN